MTHHRSAPVAAALVLLVAGLVVAWPGTGAGEPAVCGPFAQGLRLARDVAQDDAGSGRDAGDARAGAVTLRNESYSWAYMDPVDHAHADGADWYRFVLPGDGVTRVMLEVNATVAETEEYVPVPPYYHLDAFAPGATTPTVEGSPNVHGGESLAFTDTVAGAWGFRVTRDALAEAADVPCTPAPASDGGIAEENPVANYGVYFGCEPICKAPYYGHGT